MFSEVVFEGDEVRILVYWTAVTDYDLDHYLIYVRPADASLNTSWTAWNLTFPTAVVQSDAKTNLRINPEYSTPPIPREVELWIVILPVDGSGNVQYEDAVRSSLTLPVISHTTDSGDGDEDEGTSISLFEELMGSDTPTVITRSVGLGAVIIAIIALIKSNLLLQVVPDAMRWGKLAKHRIRMSSETEKELTYLQSVVTAYHEDAEELLSELDRIESEITSRFINKEIKAETKDVVISLIKDLREMDDREWAKVAHDQTWFGFAEASTTVERERMLEEEVAFREHVDDEEEPEDDSERLFPPDSRESRDDTLKWLRKEVADDSHPEIIKEQLKERGWNLGQIQWMLEQVR
jgi:hypothetical protein